MAGNWERESMRASGYGEQMFTVKRKNPSHATSDLLAFRLESANAMPGTSEARPDLWRETIQALARQRVERSVVSFIAGIERTEEMLLGFSCRRFGGKRQACPIFLHVLAVIPPVLFMHKSVSFAKAFSTVSQIGAID